jgi:hypothetical protein
LGFFVKTGFWGLQSGSGLGFAPDFLDFLAFGLVRPGITVCLSAFAAVEEFALQNFPQTRAKSDGFTAASCTARLAPNFHHKHVQPPLARFCSIQRL